MQRNWDEIDDNEILNSITDNTGSMAQFDRIMRHKMTNSVYYLGDKLMGVMETIHNAHQGLKSKADELKISHEKISNDQINSYGEISKSQNKLQKIIIALTCIIAISSAAYVFVTWKSVSAMQESNRIQRESLKVNLELLRHEQSKGRGTSLKQKP